MKTKLILAALALAIPGTAFAAEPPAPPKECCCCKKGEDGKMACCKDHAPEGADHGSHPAPHEKH